MNTWVDYTNISESSFHTDLQAGGLNYSETHSTDQPTIYIWAQAIEIDH